MKSTSKPHKKMSDLTYNSHSILIGNYTDDDTPTFNNFELYTDNQIRFFQKSLNTYLYVTRSAGSVNTRDGAWHRIAAVRRDGQIFIYLDGQQLGAAQSDTLGPYSLYDTYICIGSDLRSPALPLNGTLDQARIWCRALTTNEVAGLVASNAVPRDGLIVEYASFPTNTLRTAGFPGDRFMRSLETGTNSARLAFSELPRHNKISIGMLLAQLDSLDPLQDDDRFVIKIDGEEALSVGLGPDQGSEPQVSTLRLFGQPADIQIFKDTLTLDGQKLFSCGGWYSIGQDSVYNDHVYDLSLLEALQNFPHTSSTLVIEILGIQNGTSTNEGFGIDKIRLTAHPPLGTLIMIY